MNDYRSPEKNKTEMIDSFYKVIHWVLKFRQFQHYRKTWRNINTICITWLLNNYWHAELDGNVEYGTHWKKEITQGTNIYTRLKFYWVCPLKVTVSATFLHLVASYSAVHIYKI